MKFFFVLFMFVTQIAHAENTEIICLDSKFNASFSIDTKEKRVFYSDFANDYSEVSGAVFSGVSSPQNYTGEILGEIKLGGKAYYVTLILRNINNNAQLEALFYLKNSEQPVIRRFLNNCLLGLDKPGPG